MRLGAKSRLLAATVMISLPATGLAKPPRWERSATVKWADEAGSVTVSPISVIPWEEAAPLLQPKFTMTADQALAQAIPTTQSEDTRLAYLFNMAMRLSLPTATTTTTQTTEGSTKDDAFVTTSKRVGERGPGSLEGLEEATIPGRTADALGGLTTPAAFERDPMLRHLAATALYQEVALLNRHVSDAVRYRNAQAFLVRLQLSVIPSKRSLPYDVTTDITIHPGDMMARAGLAQPSAAVPKSGDEEGTGTTTAAESETAIETARKAALERLLESYRNEDGSYQDNATVRRLQALYKEPKATGSCRGRWDTVSVVPMVVTDNLESITASRSTDFARQMGLALMATIYNIGAGAEFGETKEAIRRAQGRDTNSLLTLARLTDDTVRVRLGAAESPTLGNTMLPRTHNISLVVIYRPCDGEAIHPAGEERMLTTVTKAAFTDAFTGKPLPYQPPVDRLVDMTVAMNRKYNNRFSYLEYAHLYRLVSRQDRDGFMDFFAKKLAMAKRDDPKDKARKLCPGLSRKLSDWKAIDLYGKHGSRAAEVAADREDEEFLNYLYGADGEQSIGCIREQLAYDVAPNALWTDLQSLRPFGEYSYANVPVTLRKIVPQLPLATQTTAVTYGDSGATVTLLGGKYLGPARDISATLKVADAVGSHFFVPSTSAAVSADGTAIALRFPTLAGFAATGKKPKLDATGQPVLDPAGQPLTEERGADKTASIELRVGRMEDGRRFPCEPAGVPACPTTIADNPSATGDTTPAATGETPKAEGEAARGTAKGGAAATQTYNRLHFVQEKKVDDKPQFTISAPATAILAGADAKGVLSILIRPTPDVEQKVAKPRLMIDGAEVTEVTWNGAGVAGDGLGWTVGAGRVVLKFDNLLPGQRVKVSLTDENGKAQVAAALEKLIFAKLVAAQKD